MSRRSLEHRYFTSTQSYVPNRFTGAFLKGITSMSQAKTARPSRNIPEHVKRAVRARDGNRCRNCKVETEFVHFDHIIPYDLGGPNTADNIQMLCPKCNTSKGNQVTCPRCSHWMTPDKPNCSQCGARLTHTKHSETFAGRMESLFQRVGRAVVLSGAVLVLLAVLTGGYYVYSRFRDAASDGEQSAKVSAVVNQAFSVSPGQPAAFRIIVPQDASNARVVGGYKVTGGHPIDFSILDEAQYGRWSGGTRDVAAVAKRPGSTSIRLRQVLKPGTYYLIFATAEGAAEATKVAAEFYLKYD